MANDDSTKASQAAKDLAAENNLDLSQVPGTGADGQITKPDVEAALASGGGSPQAAAAAAPDANENDRLIYVELNDQHPELRLNTVALHVDGKDFYPGKNDPRNQVLESEWHEKYKGVRLTESDLAPLKKGGAV